MKNEYLEPAVRYTVLAIAPVAFAIVEGGNIFSLLLLFVSLSITAGAWWAYFDEDEKLNGEKPYKVQN